MNFLLSLIAGNSKLASTLQAGIAALVALGVHKLTGLSPTLAAGINQPAVDATVFAAVMVGINYLTNHVSNSTAKQILQAVDQNLSASSISPAKTSLILFLLIPALVLSGCVPSTASVEALTEGAVKTDLVLQPQNQVYAIEVYQMAVVVRSFSGGALPTVAQFKAALLAVHASQKDLAFITTIASDLSGAYSSLFSALGKNATVATTDAYIEAFAEGVENGTAGYITATAAP
jgi:hypothetical protein